MPKTPSTENRSFLVQIYFVLATLIGLVLIVIASVNVVQLGLKEILGVQPYPEYRAPYPSMEKYPGEEAVSEAEMTAEQQEKLAQWEREYDQWKEQEANYNSQDQQLRRDIASSLAMLIVGIPVFVIHAPYVFRKK